MPIGAASDSLRMTCPLRETGARDLIPGPSVSTADLAPRHAALAPCPPALPISSFAHGDRSRRKGAKGAECGMPSHTEAIAGGADWHIEQNAPRHRYLRTINVTDLGSP